MYDHTFYKQVQISRSDIRPHIKWDVSLVILHMITSIFLWALFGYIWVNILTLSLRGGHCSVWETEQCPPRSDKVLGMRKLHWTCSDHVKETHHMEHWGNHVLTTITAIIDGTDMAWKTDVWGKSHSPDFYLIEVLTLKVLVATIDAQWEGMGDVESARYEPALLPPCSTIRVLSYSN